MKTCKFCQKNTSYQGGDCERCHKCNVWYFYQNDEITCEVYRCRVDSMLCDFIIDYRNSCSYIENLWADVLWSYENIVCVTPDSVASKIKMILTFQ